MPTKTILLGVDPTTTAPDIPSAIDANPPRNGTIVTESSRHTMNVDRRHLIEVFRRVQQERATWPTFSEVSIPLAFGFPVVIVAVTSDKFEGEFLGISSGLWTAMFAVMAALAFSFTLFLFIRWLVLVRPFQPTPPEQWTDTVCEEQIADETKHQAFKRRMDEARAGRRTQ